MDNKRQNERNKAYSKIAQKYKNLFINELQKKPIDRKIYELFFERVVNKGEILEIGCGPGEISNYLWMKGLEIAGIDCSNEMIKQLRNTIGRLSLMWAMFLSLIMIMNLYME